MAAIAGRGLRKPVVTWTTDRTRCVLRVDDQQNPEFWLEISLTQREVELIAWDVLGKLSDLPEFADYEFPVPEPLPLPEPDILDLLPPTDGDEIPFA